jgi:hypothetical protein
MCGTFVDVAPEMIQFEKYDPFKVDILECRNLFGLDGDESSAVSGGRRNTTGIDLE